MCCDPRTASLGKSDKSTDSLHRPPSMTSGYDPCFGRQERYLPNGTSEVPRINSRRVAAYSLLLSLNRHAKWLSSFPAATPAARVMEDREIRLMLVLADEHFRIIGRQFGELVRHHRLLVDAVDGQVWSTDSRSSRELEHFAQLASQYEAVSRLVGLVEHHVRATFSCESAELDADPLRDLTNPRLLVKLPLAG